MEQSKGGLVVFLIIRMASILLIYNPSVIVSTPNCVVFLSIASLFF
jgi:hypothetical protein